MNVVFKRAQAQFHKLGNSGPVELQGMGDAGEGMSGPRGRWLVSVRVASVTVLCSHGCRTASLAGHRTWRQHLCTSGMWHSPVSTMLTRPLGGETRPPQGRGDRGCAAGGVSSHTHRENQVPCEKWQKPRRFAARELAAPPGDTDASFGVPPWQRRTKD